MLRVEATALLIMAVALAGPVPAALARTRWTARDPLVALILWQAVGLAGGLSILGAGCTLAVSGLGRGWLGGMAALFSGRARLDAVGWIGVGLTAVAGVWLVGVAAASGIRVNLARRQHRVRLDAVAETLEERPAIAVGGPREPAGAPSVADVCLIDHPLAVAYCLPGIRRNRIVISRGTLQVLTPDEFDAVLAHETAHARGRHDLVVQPFVAWRNTFPFLAPAAEGLGAVEGLIEMLADDRARRDCSPAALRQALRRLATEHLTAVPAAGPQLDRTIESRVSRLAFNPEPLARRFRVMVLAVAAVLVLGPPLALILS